MNDIARWVAETGRDVRRSTVSGRDGCGAVLRRNYDTTVEDLWDAITSPNRVEKWFLPVSGDLKPGGKFQLEDNAHGEILECDPPHLLRLSWLYGDMAPMEVVARVSSSEGGGATLELEHMAPVEGEAAAEFVLGVGPGWDPSLMALGEYLQGEIPDKTWWESSPEAREVIERSIQAWTSVLNERGIASPDVVVKAAQTSREMYLGDQAAQES